jgi:DNA ligase D-like protein (predicted ligase)
MPDDPFGALSAAERALLKPEPLPDRVDPMKAVLTEERFSDPAWIYERKLDGIRCIAIKADQRVRLLSRNDLSLNARFAGVAAALEEDAGTRFVLDGEVVAFAGGQTSFERLQQQGERPVEIFYYVFDLLHLAGQDVTALPLRARKALLRRAVGWHGPLRLTQHRNGDGVAFYEEACKKRWEGLIAKRADAPYVRGRSREWLKFKCSAEQELVIGGYTAPRGSRAELGALLLGHFEDGVLRYAGKVGAGFNNTARRAELLALLEPLVRDTSPFDPPPPRRQLGGAIWVEPKVVIRAEFAGWTSNGIVRQASYKGLDLGKDARKVVRETPGER